MSRYGEQRAQAVTMMTLLLPGVGVTYNGEEIGMEDTWISWEDTKDPQGCNAGRDHYETASRDPERTPFQWDDTTSAGRSPKQLLGSSRRLSPARRSPGEAQTDRAVAHGNQSRKFPELIRGTEAARRFELDSRQNGE